MARMGRALLLLCVALLALGAGNPQPQNAERPKTDQKAPVQPPPANYAPYPDWQAQACYKAKDHNAADLCAQWRAAVAAEKAAHEARRATTWAIVATIFSVFAFGVLIWSLIQTERSLGEARVGNRLSMKQNVRSTRRAIAAADDTSVALAAAHKSAEAAAEQVVVAQEMAYRQLRAYLSFENVKATSITDNTITGYLTIRNAGKTPAKIKLYLGHWIGKHPAIDQPAESPDPVYWSIHGPFINANSTEEIQWFYPMSVLVDEEQGKRDIAKLLENDIDNTLYLYGRVEFTDFRRRSRILHFAFRHNGKMKKGPVDIRMTPCLFGNDYEDKGVAAA